MGQNRRIRAIAVSGSLASSVTSVTDEGAFSVLTAITLAPTAGTTLYIADFVDSHPVIKQLTVFDPEIGTYTPTELSNAKLDSGYNPIDGIAVLGDNLYIATANSIGVPALF